MEEDYRDGILLFLLTEKLKCQFTANEGEEEGE